MNSLKPHIRAISSPESGDFAGQPRIRKWPISFQSVGLVSIACDAIIILGSCVLSGVVYHSIIEEQPAELSKYVGSAAVVAALFCSAMKIRGLYDPAQLMNVGNQIRQTSLVWLGVFLFLTGVMFSLKIGKDFSRGANLSFAAVGLGLLVVQRVLWRSLLVRGLSERKFSGREIVLITTGDANSDHGCVGNLINYGFRLQRRFSFPNIARSAQLQNEAVSEVLSYLRGSRIQEIVLGGDLKDWSTISEFLYRLRTLPLPVSFIPTGAAAELLARPSHVIGDTVCIELHRGPLSGFERAIKRSFDLTAAAIGLLLLSPLLVITAVAIKLDSSGPILFRQKRCGFNGRAFQIFKFRTMSVMEDSAIIHQARPSDSRVTRLGWLLRRTSIDELPQLLNVINGSMSLVGPRPHAVAHDNTFDKLVSNYAFRHHVKPGLTGWAQVNGFRGPTPRLEDVQRRVDFDLWYIDNWTFTLDLLIALRTIAEVLRGRNAV
jgi:Undecaprenyl-phosphate glucose phosphotransferase